MKLSNNTAILAAAGSRKTQSIIDAVAAAPGKRILITTYTVENQEQIRRRIVELYGVVPSKVTVVTWFTFLLRECIKPYQNAVTQTNRVQSLNFGEPHNDRAKRSNIDDYYFDGADDLYARNAADFATVVNEQSGGKIIARLCDLYDHIYVDEVQDLVGYDLQLLDLLLSSPIPVTMVGDPRQSIYFTSRTPKNKAYKGLGMFAWFKEREKRGKLTVDWRTESYRCHQGICDFADELYPGLPATVSMNAEVTGHDGVFEISKSQLDDYIATYQPVLLRHRHGQDTGGHRAINFGISKGSTYERVVIFPTGPMKKYLKSRNVEDVRDVAKFYVAVTRARSSVAFVI